MNYSKFSFGISFLGSLAIVLFHASSCLASKHTTVSNAEGVTPTNLETFVRSKGLNSDLSLDSILNRYGSFRRVESLETAPTPAPTTETSSQGKTKTTVRELWADTYLELSNATDLMGTTEKGTFEMTALKLLQNEYMFEDEYYLDFLEVNVRGQAFLYPEEHESLETRVGNLTVFFNVSAIVFPANTEGIHFQDSVESFFETHKSTFLSLLVENDSFFEPASIQATTSTPGTQDRETKDDSWTDIFSTPVIIGVSVGMAIVVLSGMFVIGRLVQKDDDSLSGRIGAGPSDEEASIQELSVHDDQAIFMSFSQASKAVSAMKIPEYARRDDATTGGNTLESVHTTSTNGSHLAGLDIENVGSVSTMGSVSKGTVAAYSTSTAGRLGGSAWEPGTPISAQQCDEIRQRSRNILDDTDSLVGVQTGSMESDVSGASTFNQVQYGAPSANLARARENKRRLEQCLKDSKRRTHETNAGDDTASTNSVSLQDLVKASSRWTGGASNNGSDARSHLASQSSHPGPSVGSAGRKEELGKAELVALAEIIPVHDPTPKHDEGIQKRPVYESISDIPGAMLDEDRDDNASSIRGDEDVFSGNASNWRSFATPPRHENNKKNQMRLPDRKVWSAGSASVLRKTLFGKKGDSVGGSEETSNRFLSPSQRYRLSDRGHLVPRRLTQQMASPIAEASPTSQVSSLGGEDSHLLGITPQKFRPPQLDMNELDDDTVQDENDDLAERDNVETPLAVHPLPSTLHAALLDSSRGRLSFHTKSPSAHTIYGQGMIFGQDPDGFTLSSYYSKGLVGGGGGRPLYCDPPPVVTMQKDPPTAKEYRLRSQKKGRPTTMELAVADHEDVVILGSIGKGTKAEMELEWANMI